MNIIQIYKKYKIPENLQMHMLRVAACGAIITEVIAKEEGLLEEEIKVMNDKIFIKNDETAKSFSYITKIAAYCDQRVALNGVSSLNQRMEEGKERYKNRPGTSFNNPRTDEMIAYSMEIEKQIMEHCKITPEEINDVTIQEYIEELIKFEIHKNKEKEEER